MASILVRSVHTVSVVRYVVAQTPFEKLLKTFQDRFQDSNLVLSSLRKLEKLEQTGSAAAYANQFQELLTYIDWNPFMQVISFDRGLKAELKKALIHVERPDNLDEWIPIVIAADNQLHNLKLDLKRKSTSGSSSSKPHHSGTTFTYYPQTQFIGISEGG